MADAFDPDAAALNALAVVPMQLQMAQAEFNQAVTTAHAFPRSPDKVAKAILSMATMQDAAQGCVYNIPRKERDGTAKQIVGPSIRFAEIIAACWGNCNVGARIVGIDRQEKVVIVEGVFWDLETGTKRVQQTQRNIATSGGKLYSLDMITVTANAAMSIALREAILRGVPRAVWWPAYKTVLAVIAGDAKSMEQNRAMAMAYFTDTLKVAPARVFAALEVNGISEVGMDQIVALRTMATAIKDGEATIDSLFPTIEEALGREGAQKAAARAAVTQQAPDTPAADKAAAGAAVAAGEAKAEPEAAQVVEDEPKAGGDGPGQATLALDDAPKEASKKEQKLQRAVGMITRDLSLVRDHSDVAVVREDYEADIMVIEAEYPDLNEKLTAAFKQAEDRLNG